MKVIAHISDLHISKSTFEDEVFFKAVDEINDLSPDFILLTGDITNNGYYSEFQKAMEYFKNFKPPLYAVPGNHDARHVGYEVFEELIGQRKWVLREYKDLTILGLDSSVPDLNNGHIGRPQQTWMEDEFDKCLKESTFSIVAMHHHVIPVPKTGRERNVLSDAGDILQSVIDYNIGMVLCGHKHVPHLWKMENTLFIHAGSLSSIKLRGKNVNSYNTYFISDDSVDAVLNRVGGDKSSLGKFSRI